MLSEFIRKKAKDKGWSVSTLEKKAGLKSGSVHNIMSGRSRNPSILIMQSIASALDCSVADLIETEESTKKPSLDISRVTWDGELYLECVSYLMKVLKSKKTTLSREEFMHLVDEVYCYSAKVGATDVDKRFVDWILDKTVSY